MFATNGTVVVPTNKYEQENLTPSVLAMVLCDHVHRDLSTGKCTLIGTFNRLQVHKFPAQCPPFFAYVALTDVRRELRFQLRIRDAGEARAPVGESPAISIPVPDPLAVVEMAIQVPSLNFPDPGQYKVQLFASGQLVVERDILVVPGHSAQAKEEEEQP